MPSFNLTKNVKKPDSPHQHSTSSRRSNASKNKNTNNQGKLIHKDHDNSRAYSLPKSSTQQRFADTATNISTKNRGGGRLRAYSHRLILLARRARVLKSSGMLKWRTMRAPKLGCAIL